MKYTVLTFIALLISTPAHCAAKKDTPNTPDKILLHAAYGHYSPNSVQVGQEALAAGANPNVRNQHLDNDTALHVAWNPDFVELLCTAKADVDATNDEDETALMTTARLVYCDNDPVGAEQIRKKIELLIQYKASVDAKSAPYYPTPLWRASRYCRLVQIEALLNAKADPNVQVCGCDHIMRTSLDVLLWTASNAAYTQPSWFAKTENNIHKAISLLIHAGGRAPNGILQYHPTVQWLFNNAQAEAEVTRAHSALEREAQEQEHKDDE